MNTASPTRTAVSLLPIGTTDLWLVDEARETKFTFDPQNDSSPVWSPDGSRIAFNSNRLRVANVYAKPSSGAGNEELLMQSNNPKNTHDWSADGQYILYGELGPATAADIWVLPLFGGGKLVVSVGGGRNRNGVQMVGSFTTMHLAKN
jgi:Tol biopolymer transport system component